MRTRLFTPRLLGLAAATFGLAVIGATTTYAATPQVISEPSNGKVISIKTGSTFSIVLHSTYWQYDPLTATKAIQAISDPVGAPIAPGPTAPRACTHAGSGCGTVTWKFKAKSIGSATITASRTSCGEALQCAAGQGLYSVKIKVIR